MADLILAPIATAARSNPFIVRTEAHVTSIQLGFAGAELATLDISHNNGQSWNVVLPAANNDLTVAAPSRIILSPGLYSYNKGVTVAPGSIYVSTEQSVT